VIVFDLAGEPDALLDLSAEDIAARLYVRADALPEGESRIALKEVHLNRCPALVPWAYLRGDDFARLGIDPAQVDRHAARLRAAGPALAEKVRRVYAQEREFARGDVDAGLYDGFLPDADKRLFAEVRATPPGALGLREFGFRDPRMDELLFRYRARNWPSTLTPVERERWDAYRRDRLADGSTLSEYSFTAFFAEIATLREAHPARRGLLDALDAWGRSLQDSLA
jgi:exodeoxyribonuclease I